MINFLTFIIFESSGQKVGCNGDYIWRGELVIIYLEMCVPPEKVNNTNSPLALSSLKYWQYVCSNVQCHCGCYNVWSDTPQSSPSIGIVISGNAGADEQCAPNVLSEIPVVPFPGVLAPLVGVADVHVAAAALLLPCR